jgi:hypothetical protein
MSDQSHTIEVLSISPEATFDEGVPDAERPQDATGRHHRPTPGGSALSACMHIAQRGGTRQRMGHLDRTCFLETAAGLRHANADRWAAQETVGLPETTVSGALG